MTQQARETLKKLEALNLSRAVLRRIRGSIGDINLLANPDVAERQLAHILELIILYEKETYSLDERITP